jgi:hypothetical protein
LETRKTRNTAIGALCPKYGMGLGFVSENTGNPADPLRLVIHCFLTFAKSSNQPSTWSLQ